MKIATTALLFASAAWLTTPAFAQVSAPSPAGTTPTADPAAPTAQPAPVETVGSAPGGATSTPTTEADAGGIGEIVVTANRVQSTAQKTPIALTVYSSEALASAGVHSVQALATIDPSVNVTSSTGAAYVAIRGIASTDVTEIGDPSVPVARDGFFTNRSFSIQSSLYDVQRIEVLKGPQGTLFGRNSTGGLISIITNKPSKELGGYGSLEVGNYRLANAEAGVNVPIGDKVQVRLSGIARTHRGYRQLDVSGGRGDDDKSVSGRAQIAFQPFEGFNGLVTYQHDDIDDVGDVALQGLLATVTPRGDPKRFANYQPTLTRLKGDRYRWEFSYDQLPLGLTLTYQGGYDRQRFGHATDASTLGGALRQQFVQNESPDTWNHEVRIATPTDGRFTLQAGYFHFDEKNIIDSGLVVRSGAFADRNLIKFDYRIKTQSDAVFGQAGFALTDTLKITGGARYTWDKKSRVGNAVLDLQVASGGFLPPIIITTPGNGDISQHKPTFHAGVDWTPTNTTLVYGKFDTGYKSGGFNSNGASASVDYGPENLHAFEIGTKNRFLGNHLQINADAFYQTYNGYQASQTTAVISSGSGVFNIGSAKIYGAEAQIIGLVEGAGRLDLNATYLHARFDDDIGSVARGDSAGTAANIGGNRLPNAPSFVASAGFEHEFEIGNARLTARIDGKYSSSFYYSVFNDADTKQKEYATGNLTLTYAPIDGPWQLQAFVRNFTDATVLANAARNFVANVNTYQFAPPRTYGGRMSFKF